MHGRTEKQVVSPTRGQGGGCLWVKNIQMKILELKNITHSSPYGLNIRMKVIEERLSEDD